MSQSVARCVAAFSLRMSSVLCHLLWRYTPGLLPQEEDWKGWMGVLGERCDEHVRTCVGHGSWFISGRSCLVVLIKSLESCSWSSIVIDFNFNLPLYHFLLVIQHNSSGVGCRQSMSLAGRTHFVCLMSKEKKNH